MTTKKSPVTETGDHGLLSRLDAAEEGPSELERAYENPRKRRRAG